SVLTPYVAALHCPCTASIIRLIGDVMRCSVALQGYGQCSDCITRVFSSTIVELGSEGVSVSMNVNMMGEIAISFLMNDEKKESRFVDTIRPLTIIDELIQR